ncbi:CdaR family protein [Desulfospira joergensenii]|uniref:CdaR family protein n=1 Tax=Desulfospira joergensenii TaxID=53329 RepID=UPI000407BFAF|nr:CdaR family protein [Desulfospira joergensenii]
MPDQGITRILVLFLSAFLLSGCTPEPAETDLLLPVVFSNVPSDMVLTSFNTDKIEIRVQAEPSLIQMINGKNIHYPADLYTDLEFDPAGASESIWPGNYLLPVDKNRIPVDPAIRILDINPPYLSVHLERKVTRTFKITVPYTGKPAQGHIFLEAACDPANVTLTGALSLIDSIDVLKTKPIDINNASETFKKKIPLDLEDHKLYSASDSIIVVTVPIQEKRVAKEFKDIPIQIWNTDSTVSIEPGSISVVIKGPFDSMGNKEVTDRLFAFIDLKDLKPGVYARHVNVNVPVGMIMTGADPKVFTVKIQ